jgi:hypothetical protein
MRTLLVFPLTALAFGLACATTDVSRDERPMPPTPTDDVTPAPGPELPPSDMGGGPSDPGATSGTSPGGMGSSAERGTRGRIDTGMPGGTGSQGDTYGGPAGTGRSVSGGRSSGGIIGQTSDELNQDRRDHRTDVMARLQRIEERVRTIERDIAVGDVNQAELRDLKAQHKSLQAQVQALDRVTDEAWFTAKDNVDDQLVSLERRLENLDNPG